MNLPNSYTPAEWRNTTPVCSDTERIGIGFNLADGSVVRLSISLESASFLTDTLRDYLPTCHSEILSGIPSVAVSMPEQSEQRNEVAA